MRLTKRAVEAAKPAERDVFLWDDAMPGFGLRVLPSGKRGYLIQYRAKGRTRRLALGLHGTLTPEQARRLAAEQLACVRRGEDPSADRAAARHAATVAEFSERYLAQHADVKKKPRSVEGDRALLRLHVLPALGRRKLEAVNRADVIALHHAMRGTPGAANRVLALLSKMFNLAERWGVRPDGSNPCRHVERYPSHPRERYLSDAELTRLGEAIREAEQTGGESREAIAALRLLVFTGCRLGEVLGLRWGFVDFERACLRLPDSKTGAKVVPLNAPALAVLASLDRRSEWVLPGRDGAGHLFDLNGPWRRAQRRAGLEGVRLHDLRHSFASVGAGSGHSLHVIGGLLGHRSTMTTKRYAHLADDPLRSATEAIGARLAAALEARPVAPLVTIGSSNGARAGAMRG